MWDDTPELYRGRFYAKCGTGRNKRRKSLRTDDLDLARQRLRDLQRQSQEEPVLIREIYAGYMVEKENRYKNLQYIWNCLGEHFGHLRPDQIDREVCKAYWEKRDVSDGTILRELGALRAAVRWHDPKSNAVFALPKAPPPRDRYLTREELQRLLGAIGEPHLRLYVILAVCTAARKSAILQLKWSQVDFSRNLIDFGQGESNKRRATVPINSTARIALLAAYKARLSDHVIEYMGRPIKDIKRSFKTAVDEAGLEDVHPHVLRHTAAVWMAEGGVPMAEIAQYLGHTSSRVTERVYARFSPEYLKNAARTLELGAFAPNDLPYTP